jgi:septum formation protein
MSLKIILGSQSPRRKELLGQMGYDFGVLVSDIDETIDPELPIHKVPESIAVKKAEALRNQLKEDEVLITADTLVILDNEAIGKPANEAEAFQILSRLSNQKHLVITGVCLQSHAKTICFSATTEVYFGALSPSEIQSYIKRYSPFDKAGSYGIQEWIGYIGVEKIVGSYTNVMGLPTHELYNALKKFMA